MCRGGVTGQGKFPKKMWFFGRFSEQRAKKNSAQINRYNWHFLCSLQVDVIPKKWKQPLIFWIELFDFHILEMQTLPNAKLWSLAGLDLCNLCESASWPVLAYIHSQVYLCLCYRHTTPKYPLWLIWGRGSFLTCSQSGKAASENSKSSREDLYRCTLPTGTRKSIVRSKCTSEWKDNIAHKQLKHIQWFNDILWQARYWVSERDQVAFMAYLLYIRISGFHNAEGGIRTSSTLPYSLVFHAKLTSSHSWREIIFNQVEFMWKYFAETTHQI